MSSETISLLTIPLFSAAIGYVTNWTGVWMLFNPLRFAGFRLPGLRAISQILPRRVEQQYPSIVHEIFERIGRNIDQLLDVKLMVMRRIEQSPELANKIFHSVGDKELRLIINMGFVLGLVLGIPVAGLTALVGQPWVLLVCGPVVGWVTNWVAIVMIFEPVEPRRILGIRLQGMFLRRQP